MLIARWTPYLESEMLGLASVIERGSVCLDVGAAAGLYSLVLSRLVGPSGQVHAVEPLSFAHPMWRRVLRISYRQNVSHYARALGAEPGSGVMSVPFSRHGPVTGRSFLTGRSSGLGSNTEFIRHDEVTVDVDTIDALISRAGDTRLDFIKIDGAFVRDINEDQNDYAMVRSINDLAHYMGLQTIAEYVESDEILQKLMEIGVDYAQGYEIEKPRWLDSL